MKKGFIRRDGMTLRQTKHGETLYESVRIQNADVIDYIAQESKKYGISPTQVIATMIHKYYSEYAQKEEK